MQITDIFPDRSEATISLARKWLLLGLAALIAAGLFAILLVMSRTPGVEDVIPLIDFFHVALVVHVNLSVLIWFMSFACLLWTLTSEAKLMPLAQLSFYLALAGTLILAVCPFFGVGNPLMNNYIPTLQHPVFFVALGLFGAGVALRIFISLIATRVKFTDLTIADGIRMGVWLAAFICLLVFWALYRSYSDIPDLIEGNALPAQAYFELLYWGGGHILQFNHSLLMLLVWLILILLARKDEPIQGKWILALSALVALPVLEAFHIYFAYPVSSDEHRHAFTRLMSYGGLASLPMGVMIGYLFFKSWDDFKENTLNRTVLMCSGILFIAGGVIGFLIEGVNVVIPAHYHGSIVGVTLAFMGLAYLLLPYFGYAPANVKLAKIQMYTYTVGQIMHITGLAWSGGYGVQRKTAGAAQALTAAEKIPMGLMGMGGAIAIIGGILFMVVMLIAIRESRKAENPA